MGVTIKSVAAAVGVSPATVSNAYNKPDQLSADLRNRVLAEAARLGYAGPNPTARNLRSGRAGAFGLLYNHSLTHAFSDPFATTFLGGVGGVIEQDGSALVLIPLHPGTGEFNLDLLRRTAVDGLADVCLDEEQSEQVHQIARQRGIPFISSCSSRPDLDFVGPDDLAAGRALAEHVMRLGHRRVAIVADGGVTDGPLRLEPLGQPGWDRLKGLADGLAGAEVTVVNGQWNTLESGRRAGAELLDRQHRPTAIIAVSDILALGILRAAADRGVDVPRELSVTGFDDIPAAADAGLTTVAQQITERGQLVGRLLLDPTATPRRVFLPTTLQARRTTGPAPD